LKEREERHANNERSRPWLRFDEQRKEARDCQQGGKAAHAMGTAHTWTSQEAQAAGRKGGAISRRRPKPTAQA